MILVLVHILVPTHPRVGTLPRRYWHGLFKSELGSERTNRFMSGSKVRKWAQKLSVWTVKYALHEPETGVLTPRSVDAEKTERLGTLP